MAQAKEEKSKGKGPEAEAGAAEAAALKDYVPGLKLKYREEIVPALMKRFGYRNIMQVPRLVKVVVNMGVGEAAREAKLLDAAEKELAQIAGQKPRITRAKKSISAFKVREGMPVGCFVTLRGNMMYEFLERLICVAIPRVRDFRGLPTRSFDGRGNHSMGIREHLIFMELDYNKVSTVRGMNITTVTSAETDEEALELLRLFGFPFREK
jgi:large subunit ribosomal protein L5